ncbi:interleukin-20 receptor subunit alpha [Odontesthes bonariensis]|uniref:interleukin-20 receptor subunit alpha n=1 Tax=Odontesthes bonariensis TaxID=219752 RepID=UPI003F588A89
MWTLFVFINLLGLHCTVSTSPPSPISVTFSSVNLRNVLHWFAGNGTPNDTHFTVQYAIYGDSIEGRKGRQVHWRAVQQCTDIVRTWCDLSAETWDLEQGYYARVRAVGGRASSKWALTQRRFDPKSDTTFGPPQVLVEIENSSALITLRGPMRYLPNDTPLSMAAIYPHMSYHLSIHKTHRNETHLFPVATSLYKYPLLDYNTEYCFSAKSRFLSMPVHCEASEWHCITTPQDPVIVQLQMIVVGIVVPSLFICIIGVAGYLLYPYLTGRGQKTPYMLNPPSFYPPSVMVISVIKDEWPSDPRGPEIRLCPPDPPPNYSPQRPDTPPEPEEPRDDLSEDYGSVCVDPIVDVAGEEEARTRCPDSNKNREGSIEGGNPAGDYSSQAKSYLSQRPTHTCVQTHRPIYAEQMVPRVWSQGNPPSPAQTQAQLQSSQGSVTGELNREKDGELLGLFIRKDPQTGLLSVILNLQTQQKVDEKTEVDEKKDGGEEEGSECEIVPLLSAYASQSIKGIPASHSIQPDCLSHGNGVLGPAAKPKTEEDYFADEKEEMEGTMCINWDPKTRKLVLPEMKAGFNTKERLDGPMPSERGREDRIAEKNEGKHVPRGGLKLENVCVRQTSEEETEALRGQGTGLEVEDILTKWDLVIPMDQ